MAWLVFWHININRDHARQGGTNLVLPGTSTTYPSGNGVINITEATTKELAYLFMVHVTKNFGIPCVIVSDRDPKWTSHLWRALMHMMHIDNELSTARHQQTDGKCERAIKTIKQMLRPYLTYAGTNWVELLPLLEYNYNCTPNNTGMSPFEIDIVRIPKMDTWSASDTTGERVRQLDGVETAQLRLLQESQEVVARIVQQTMKENQDRQARYYDQSRRAQQFKVGDLVLLSRKDLDIKGVAGTNERLSDQWIGPFKVKAKGKHPDTYELELTLQFKALYPVFHVSILRPYVQPGTSEFRTEESPPESIEVDGEIEYPVERIVAARTYKRRPQVLVKWLGYGTKDNTWEAVERVENTEAYHAWLAGARRSRSGVSPQPKKYRKTNRSLRSRQHDT